MMPCSYCRITGQSRNLPKPNYPPLIPLPQHLDGGVSGCFLGANEKRVQFCKITSDVDHQRHHYVPSSSPSDTELWARRGSGSPCRVMRKSRSMELHHFTPTYADLAAFSHVEGCRITQKNRSLRDYRYVYPCVLLGATDDAGRSNAEAEDEVMREMQFSMSYMHHFIQGYEYVCPTFATPDERTRCLEQLKKKLGVSTSGHPSVQPVTKEGHKYVYSVCDDLCSLVVPSDVEEILRLGKVDNIWLTADRKEMVIELNRSGTDRKSTVTLSLATQVLTSEELHEDLEGKNLLPGIAGGSHAIRLMEEQRSMKKSRKKKKLRSQSMVNVDESQSKPIQRNGHAKQMDVESIKEDANEVGNVLERPTTLLPVPPDNQNNALESPNGSNRLVTVSPDLENSTSGTSGPSSSNSSSCSSPCGLRGWSSSSILPLSPTANTTRCILIKGPDWEDIQRAAAEDWLENIKLQEEEEEVEEATETNSMSEESTVVGGGSEKPSLANGNSRSSFDSVEEQSSTSAGSDETLTEAEILVSALVIDNGHVDIDHSVQLQSNQNLVDLKPKKLLTTADEITEIKVFNKIELGKLQTAQSVTSSNGSANIDSVQQVKQPNSNEIIDSKTQSDQMVCDISSINDAIVPSVLCPSSSVIDINSNERRNSAEESNKVPKSTVFNKISKEETFTTQKVTSSTSNRSIKESYSESTAEHVVKQQRNLNKTIDSQTQSANIECVDMSKNSKVIDTSVQCQLQLDEDQSRNQVDLNPKKRLTISEEATKCNEEVTSSKQSTNVDSVQLDTEIQSDKMCGDTFSQIRHQSTNTVEIDRNVRLNSAEKTKNITKSKVSNKISNEDYVSAQVTSSNSPTNDDSVQQVEKQQRNLNEIIDSSTKSANIECVDVFQMKNVVDNSVQGQLQHHQNQREISNKISDDEYVTGQLTSSNRSTNVDSAQQVEKRPQQQQQASNKSIDSQKQSGNIDGIEVFQTNKVIDNSVQSQLQRHQNQNKISNDEYVTMQEVTSSNGPINVNSAQQVEKQPQQKQRLSKKTIDSQTQSANIECADVFQMKNVVDNSVQSQLQHHQNQCKVSNKMSNEEYVTIQEVTSSNGSTNVDSDKQVEKRPQQGQQRSKKTIDSPKQSGDIDCIDVSQTNKVIDNLVQSQSQHQQNQCEVSNKISHDEYVTIQQVTSSNGQINVNSAQQVEKQSQQKQQLSKSAKIDRVDVFQVKNVDNSVQSQLQHHQIQCKVSNKMSNEEYVSGQVTSSNGSTNVDSAQQLEKRPQQEQQLSKKTIDSQKQSGNIDCIEVFQTNKVIDNSVQVQLQHHQTHCNVSHKKSNEYVTGQEVTSSNGPTNVVSAQQVEKQPLQKQQLSVKTIDSQAQSAKIDRVDVFPVKNINNSVQGQLQHYHNQTIEVLDVNKKKQLTSVELNKSKVANISSNEECLTVQEVTSSASKCSTDIDSVQQIENQQRSNKTIDSHKQSTNIECDMFQINNAIDNSVQTQLQQHRNQCEVSNKISTDEVSSTSNQKVEKRPQLKQQHSNSTIKSESQSGNIECYVLQTNNAVDESVQGQLQPNQDQSANLVRPKKQLATSTKNSNGEYLTGQEVTSSTLKLSTNIDSVQQIEKQQHSNKVIDDHMHSVDQVFCDMSQISDIPQSIVESSSEQVCEGYTGEDVGVCPSELDNWPSRPILSNEMSEVRVKATFEYINNNGSDGCHPRINTNVLAMNDGGCNNQLTEDLTNECSSELCADLTCSSMQVVKQSTTMNESLSSVTRSPRVRFRHPEVEEIPDRPKFREDMDSRICTTPKIGNVPVNVLTSEDNDDESDTETVEAPVNGDAVTKQINNGTNSDDDDEVSGIVSKILREHTAGISKSFRERYRLSSLDDDDDDNGSYSSRDNRDPIHSLSPTSTTHLSSDSGPRAVENGSGDETIELGTKSLISTGDLFVREGSSDDDDVSVKKQVPRAAADKSDDDQAEDPVKKLAIGMKMAGYTPPLRLRDLIEQYVVVRDFSPKATDVGSIILREGQIVEVIDSESDTERWLVRTRPSKYLSPRQGWIPISYLEKKSTDTNYISILEDDYEIRSDSKEREAAQKRRNVVKELVETEEEFVSDMQHVVHTYLREMDNPRMPKELRDSKDDIFLNFKEICDFHNNVLIKGVQYYAGEPTKLGKTFLRLERDFDMHADYCQQEPQAQELLSTLPVKEYFEEYSKRIGEIDRSLSDHLKLPIQRINDYQLLLKELIKYTARLKEDCSDLQKALDLMQGIPQRANDLKLTGSILGFKGNIHKLGRLLRHQDWFTITDSSGRSKERYLFLFKSRIFVTKVRRLSEDKSSYILKDIIKLPDIEVVDTGNERQFEVHLKGNAETIGSSRYPLIFEAQSDNVKEAWFKELGDVKRDIVVITDISEEGIIEDLTEDRSSDDVLDEEIVEAVVQVREEPIETFAEQLISDEALIEEILVKEIVKDSRKRSIDEEEQEVELREQEVEEIKRPKVEILENFQAYEELNTVMTDSIKSGSATPLDANECEDGTTRPRFHKSLRGQTCLRGDTVTLECEPYSIPPATIAWLKDNVPLTQSSKIQFVNKGNSQYLVIKDTKNEDSGVYSCKATNKNGTAACSAQLNILGPEEIKSNPSTPEPKKPQFTITFKDTELLEGTSVRFLVKVRANPDSDIKFFKNDKPLKEDSRIKIIAEDKGTYELSIAHVTANDAGKYTCKAKNNLGESEFSSVVKVTAEKDLFPGVQEHVQNGGITHPGENNDFKWFRDGLECEASERFKVLFRDEEDTLALVFQHVKPEDAGLYTCVASTTSGRISCSAELSVEGSVSQLMRDPEPPKIIAELTDVEVNQGTSAMLELKVTGYPKPAITWSKDGSEIKAGSKYKVLHEDDESMALIIKNVASEDAGKYAVKAKNALGEVSSAAKVVVKSPPKFRKTLKDAAVMSEETIRFDVEIEGEPTPEVTWYKDGQLIKESERIKITESSKNQTYSFEIKKSRSEDAGNYSCVATNSSGKISEFGHVTVNEAAKFLKEMKSVEVRESDTVKFDVKVAGQPQPSVKWMKGSVEIKEDGKHFKTEQDDRNYSLIIDKVGRDEAAKYSCVISNEFGSSTSAGDLTINSVPQYVEKLSDMTVKEGETDYKLRVKVSGYPEPKIRWFIESMEIDERSNKYKISDEGETKVLIIKKVEAESSGTYSCTISNSNGEASCQGFLNVLTKPKFVEVLKDQEKTEQEDVSLTVKVTGNPAPNLKWYKNNEEVHESATIKVSKVVDGCNTLDIKKLVEEAAGTYECHATNTEGDAVTISKLIVNTHPRFTGKMESVEVWSGEDAVIECHGISIPYPEVKWFKNGEPLEEDKRIKIVSDGDKHQIMIANTVTEDTGVFKIEMTNKLGKAELEGSLNVKASTEATVPVVLKKLDDVICIMGDNASYQAKIYSNPEPEIKWYKDGEEIIANDRFTMHNNNITHIFDLTLKNVTPSDIGKYTIVAENANGKVSSEASLDVHIPPVIQEIKDKKAMPDSAISFETKVTGKPRPSVKWVKGEKELVAGGNVGIESDDVAGVYKLTIKNLAPEDSGAYACVAENVAAVSKQPFNLNVTTEAPHFIKGLQNKGCKLNTQLKADVQVYGLPMPSVKWFKDNVELSDNSKLKLIQSDERNFSLVIDQFTEDDAGNYTCKAINQAGEAVSHAQFTLHHGLPEFLKQLPKEVCVMDGEPLALEAKVDVNPMPAIKWLKDGKEIVPDEHIKTETLPDGTVKLSIDNAVPEDKGKYTLVAINDAGQTASTGHVVVEAMPKAPSFLKKLENQEVPLGSTLKLMAKVTAYPKPTYKWLKDGKPVKVDARTKLVEHNGTLGLEIEDAKPEDEGKYTLQVSNHRGDASSSCDVTTKSATSAPEILQPLKPVSAIDGTPCRLEAKVGGTPLPTCNWFKNGVPVSPDDSRVKSVVRPDGTVALVFDKCAPGDAGKYTLEAVNPYGSNKCDSDLSVAERDKSDAAKKAPSFTLPLRDQDLDEGKPIKLVAQIDGNPYPDISWTKDGEPLKSDDNLSMSCDGNKICLEIRKSSPKDSGKYECKLSSPEGHANSKCGVNVKKLYSPPVFTQKPTDLFTIPGGDPRFVCRVGGKPKPDVTWFYNDLPLHDSPKYKIRRDGDMCSLQIKGVTLDDKGRYKCKISNDAGEDHAFANLDIGDSGDRRDKAEPPSFLKKLGDCSIMEGMSAKFTACVAGFPEPEYRWYLNNRELKDTDRIKIQVEPHGLLRLLIKNSKPEDVGSYTLKIWNPHGEIESTARLIFDQYEDKKPRKPKPDLNLDLNQIPPPKTDLDDTKSKPSKTSDDDRKPKDKMADLNIDHDKFRRYDIPFALPDKPIISKMTDRRLTLSWKPSLPRGPSVPVTYIVDMAEVPDGDWISSRSGIRGCCCEIRNLEPFRDYKFRVRVENKYGVSDPSPYALTFRQKLEMTPPRQLPRLPPELDFRPETSPYFPRDYDIDRPLHDEYAHAPRFLRQIDDVQWGVKGQPSTIEWFVYGYPTPTVEFTREGQKIDIKDRYESAVARNGQCKLYITRMFDHDVGQYECIAKNEHGEARQRINLAIAEHPVFIMPLEEESIMIRKSGSLQCRVIGQPYPQIKWYKDWHPLASSSRIKIEWKEPDLCTLTIDDVISKDGGLYSCCARNIAGMATSSAMVTIEEDENDYALLKYSHARVVRARPKAMEDFYDIGDELGRGTQGIVYHAVERSTGNSYAAKCMHGKGDTKKLMHQELDIMNQLHDRYLTRARDAFETKNALTIISDLAGGGELFESICKQNTITESEIAHFIRQILWGLEHMHGKGIAHLGLSPADILLSKPGGDDIKICDFGLARRILIGKDIYLEFGMPEFVAPEIVNRRPAGFQTDMWSVGVITYLLLSGISPFLGENDRETLRRIQAGQLTFDQDVFSNLSDEAKDFISKLLVFDSEGRMDVKSALNHPWLRFADRPGSGNTLSTDRLRNYYRRYRDWIRNSACDRFYRRRPLTYAFEHPSGMVYPPGEKYTPPSSPEASPTTIKPKPEFQPPKYTDTINENEREDLNYDLGYADSNSRYQNGPDTYLLQLRDVNFPLRLREYMRVAGSASPSLGLRLQDTISGQAVSCRERRRFTDVMDEEIDDEKKGQLDGVRRRINSEVSQRAETKNRIKELLPRVEEQSPYFREKIKDTALTEGQPIEFSCMAIGEPKPVITWYRNDVLMTESHRVKIVEESGRFYLRFNPVKAFDAGFYKVVARNVAGEVCCRARLKQGELPGKPDAPEVSQISDTEALITWHYPKADGNSPVLYYCLEYKETDDPNWKEVRSNIDHQFFVVRNLLPSKRYSFRFRAQNQFGWGDYSNPLDGVETGESGSSKVSISCAMKYQQELTESGQNRVGTTFESIRRTHIDYSAEKNLIQLSSENPTDKYHFISEISRGRFSVVVKCCHKDDSNQVFAAKLMEWSPAAEQEYEIAKNLRHERIPELHAAYHHGSMSILVMEKLLGCDVLTYLTRGKDYTEDVVARITAQVLDALEYLHFRRVLHLDVQPDNVVVSDLSTAQVKLVDLGSAQMLTNYVPSRIEKKGNAEFLAPEVLNGEDLSVHADIWSLGVLTYILLSGVSPFKGETLKDTTNNATYVRYRFENLHKEITQESQRFLMAIFKRTPIKRPTADECLELKWLTPSEYMLKKRERAVFNSEPLKVFTDEYRKQRQMATSNSEGLINAFGMQLSRSVSVEYQTMTTF